MRQDNQRNTFVVNSRWKKNIFSWGIAATLFACCLYLIISKNKVVRDNEIALKQKQQIIDSVKTDRVYLQADFDAASAKIDQLLSKNAGLKDSLQDNKAAIVALQAQIKIILSNQKATQAELMKARNMIYMLNDKTQAYELYIAELEKDNVILAGENKLLSNERDETVEKNIALKMAGAVLHASNIRLEPVHIRAGGMEKETFNAKKVDKIRIAFDIDANRIAESGTKQVYVRIIAPGNKILYADNVSGTMNTVKEQAIKFSVLKEINLINNNPVKDIVAEWQQNDTYPKGVYKIELYNEGYEIGQAGMELR